MIMTVHDNDCNDCVFITWGITVTSLNDDAADVQVDRGNWGNILYYNLLVFNLTQHLLVK